jgi:multidrug efflux pump
VTAAIRAQNAQVSAGEIGALPNVAGQGIAATVVVSGQLASVEQFGQVVLRANADGSTVRLKDVARIELGAQTYATSARLNGKPSTGIGVQLAPTGNAMATAKAVRTKMTELERFFPKGMKWAIPYDSSRFVDISIRQVAETLLEAVALVFLVMFLFLQDWRYTIIPTLVVPVALLGTFATLLAMGFSINVLTMFGMVLVIGIVVDDAIVVVENVERIMSEEGLAPLEATRKAMGQISGAIIGVTVVLISVFVPLAFFSGSVGNIYRQFAAVMGVSIAFSAFMALSLTPALCATLLKPVEAGHHHAKTGFFGWFNRGFSRTAKGYEGVVARILPRAARYLIIYVAIVAGATVVYLRLPTSFLPNEDQGTLLVNVQLPPGATQARALDVMQQVEGFMLKQPEVQSMVSVLGFSFSGQGQNAALAFVTLKDWKERTDPASSAQALAGRAFGGLSGIRDAFIFPLSPPSIPELGSSSGFSFRLQDRAGLGRDALLAARNQLLGAATKSTVITQVRPDGLEDAPQLQLDIDRDKANALGVGFRRDQQRHLHRAGLQLRERFPQRWAAAARGGAGRRAGAHATRRPAAPERGQQQGPGSAAVGLCQHALDHRADADRALQRLPLDAHQRQRGPGPEHGRGHGRDGASGGTAAAGLRLRVDRPVARGKDCRLAGHGAVRLRHPVGVPVPGRAV